MLPTTVAIVTRPFLRRRGAGRWARWVGRPRCSRRWGRRSAESSPRRSAGGRSWSSTCRWRPLPSSSPCVMSPRTRWIPPASESTSTVRAPRCSHSRSSGWCSACGGRPPLVTGYALLALSGVAMAVGIGSDEYVALLPGLLLYGTGLSLVLTTNDPVSLDSVAERDQGQASGVSATAERFGGALGIVVLYSIFHASCDYRRDAARHSAVRRGQWPQALRSGSRAARVSRARPRCLEPRLLGHLHHRRRPGRDRGRPGGVARSPA